jgi:beta-lactamase class D
MKLNSLLFFFLCSLRLAAQPQIQTDPRLQECIDPYGFKGVVLLGVQGATGVEWISNDPLDAQFATLPASTFKIPNSLIGLETGAITAETQFKWGGKPRRFERWEKDFDLPGAFQASCLPCYQEVARRVGAQRMQYWLTQLGYGNMDMGGGLEKFWLTGKLRISPIEQLYFLYRLANGQLPFASKHQATVREIMLLDDQNGRRLYGKTGWSDGKTHIGWFVGWVEGNGGPRVFFATRINALDPPDSFGPARRQISEDALALFGHWKKQGS